MPRGDEHILSVRNLSVSYGDMQALRDVSIDVAPGEMVGLVGESGSGKSTLLRAVARLLPPAARVEGGLWYEGRNLAEVSSRVMSRLRGGEISYLFQNGEQSLDPLFTIGQQFDEVLRAHGGHSDRAYERALLRRMGFEDAERVLDALPCELSGGMGQRVALAFALATSPRLLLADEPTSALDGVAQARVTALMRALNEQEGLAVLMVSHDIDLVASMTERLYVMHDGRIVEEGPSAQVLANPRAPYTRELVASIPRMPEGRVVSCC